jgi:TolA-binding protein
MTYCLECFDRIDDREKFCIACKAKLSIEKLGTKEEQLIHAVTVSRENYQKALNELRTYYQTIGNQMRLQKARRELDALNNVPQPIYTDKGLGNVLTGVTLSDIEDANVLFKDAMMYKRSLRKENRLIAINRFERILQEYPESDKVNDAAFEIAEIYAGWHFRDYESAAKYYMMSYQLNPDIKRPALLKAAGMHDKMADYDRAKVIYRQAAVYGHDKKSRKRAERRLSVLERESVTKK